jgi:hypothetical protein
MGYKPWTIEAVASCYTEYTNPASFLFLRVAAWKRLTEDYCVQTQVWR